MGIGKEQALVMAGEEDTEMQRIRAAVISARGKPTVKVPMSRIVPTTWGRLVGAGKTRELVFKLITEDEREHEGAIGAWVRLEGGCKVCLLFGGNHRNVSESYLGSSHMRVHLIEVDGMDDIIARGRGDEVVICVEKTKPRPQGFSLTAQMRLYQKWLERYREDKRLELVRLKKRARSRRGVPVSRKEILRDGDAHWSGFVGEDGNSFFLSRQETNGRVRKEESLNRFIQGADKLISTGALDTLELWEARGEIKLTRKELRQVAGMDVERLRSAMDAWSKRSDRGTQFTFRENVESAMLGLTELGRAQGGKPVKRRLHTLSGGDEGILLAVKRAKSIPEQKLTVQKQEKDLAARQKGIDAALKHIEEEESKRKAETLRASLARLEGAPSGKRTKSAMERFDELMQVYIKVRGDVHRGQVVVFKSDVERLGNRDYLSDNIIYYILYFVNAWSDQARKKVFVVEWYEHLKPWFEEDDIFPAKERELAQKLERVAYGELWTWDVVCFPVIARGHWSLAVVVGLPTVAKRLMGAPEAKKAKGGVFWVDSLPGAHTAAHKNLTLVLKACFKGKAVTEAELQAALFEQNVPVPQQQGAECGLHLGYHMSAVLRNPNVFGSTTGWKKGAAAGLKEEEKVETYEEFVSRVEGQLKEHRLIYESKKRELLTQDPTIVHTEKLWVAEAEENLTFRKEKEAELAAAREKVRLLKETIEADPPLEETIEADPPLEETIEAVPPKEKEEDSIIADIDRVFGVDGARIKKLTDEGGSEVARKYEEFRAALGEFVAKHK